LIPFFELREIQLGPIRLHAFGTLLVLGIIVGHMLVIRRGRARGLASPAMLEGFAISLGVGALVGGLVGERLIGTGLGSAFGLGGVFAAGALYTLLLRLDVLAFADLAAFAFPFGWLVARLGCVLVHDHLGPRSTSFLAVRFASGARLDMALLEWLFLPLLIGGVIAADRTKRRGATAGVVALGMALVRFPLDFLRVGDARYAGLTAMQWMSIALFALGLELVYLASRTAMSSSVPFYRSGPTSR